MSDPWRRDGGFAGEWIAIGGGRGAGVRGGGDGAGGGDGVFGDGAEPAEAAKHLAAAEGIGRAAGDVSTDVPEVAAMAARVTLVG